MNKRKIGLLIVLMSIALLGIIALQMNWIMHDIHIKEQQFDQGVTLALNDVVNKVETGEVYRAVYDHSFKVSAGPNGITFQDDSILLDLFSPPEPPAEPGLPPLPVAVLSSNIHIRHESNGQSGHTHVKIRQSRTEFSDSDTDQGQVAPGDEMAPEVTPADALTQETNTETRERELEQFTDSIHELANATEEKLRVKMQKISMVLNKMAYEFGDEQRNILTRISPGELDTMLGEELSGKGIHIPFNFGIMNRATDSLIYTKMPGHTADLLHSKHRVALFPNDLFSKPDYLLLSFPGRMNYVLSSLWLMLAGSAVFTLIIIFGFAYTIYVIFRQKKLSDIKTDFINNMTHEFKTPIATISLAVDSINDKRVYSNPEKISYFTGIIKEENKRMNAQVENVLRMAQLEKGELELKHDQVDLHELIEHSVEFIRLQVEQKNGTILFEAGAGNPVVRGDAFHLSNVLNNLFDNANKYSPENPAITIKTENTNQGILLHVSDTGMGMSAGIQEKIFEKFYRVTTGNIHNIKGFGLGLSYVKAIVEAHGGSVSVKSDVGQGSTFTVFLPF